MIGAGGETLSPASFLLSSLQDDPFGFYLGVKPALHQDSKIICSTDKVDSV